MAIERPEEIIPRLGDPAKHWKKDRSAYELAYAWTVANSFPPKIRAVLDTAEEWRGALLLDALFERTTELGTRGFPSQTDLLCVVALNNENAILGIEAKVDETFGPRGSEWLEGDRAGERASGCSLRNSRS